IYGPIPPGDPPKLFVRPEPPQQGERRFTIERPGGSAFVEIGYHVPGAADPDWFALALINSLLCGADSLGGGSIDNKTSRLYRALVETELAASIDGSLLPTIDPFLYSITAVVRAERSPEAVEQVINAEIERLRSGDVTEAELARAKKQARALFAYSTERVTMQAFWLAFAENFSSYTWFEAYMKNLEAVSLEQVRAAASQYLRPQNRVVGYFIPTQSEEANWEPDVEEEV
ncbi:MAG: insulinase family protein, partial [Anaerolinea sp.]|nr:insulinase family protein [Anaerolinea sp.]